ncbi:MAG: endonuclease V-domain-containing protein [Olpidium bornovanus]|uniref:Endonuclease V-domain-containing protein n=1 Tax=Olpidium bornovanus TaxID=278681 RepID=A0A8H7ZM69_9FUNG|nr:MAG: endonuclease V-domain-containing protein [Olpidium bornovanus]
MIGTARGDVAAADTRCRRCGDGSEEATGETEAGDGCDCEAEAVHAATAALSPPPTARASSPPQPGADNGRQAGGGAGGGAREGVANGDRQEERCVATPAVAAAAALEVKKALWCSQQLHLRKRLVTEDDRLDFVVVDGEGSVPPRFDGLSLVGGADISFPKEDGGHGNRAVASLVVLRFPTLELVYEDNAILELSEPYVAGFLAFREAPAVLDLISRLRSRCPTLVPQFGIACHVGVLADIPTIGVSKNFLQIEGRDGDFLTVAAVKRFSAQRLRKSGDSLDLRLGGLHGNGSVIGAVRCLA